MHIEPIASKPIVEVVVANWKRPQNVARIVQAFRRQSVGCVLTVCDSARSNFVLDHQTRAGLDRYYQFDRDYGPFARYIPAFNFNLPFTYFHDDDMLPGSRTLEHFLRAADERPDGAMFGQIGRWCDGGYTPADVPRGRTDYVPVDMLVRGYFVRTEHLLGLKRFQMRVAHLKPRDDDMLLAMGIRAYTNKSILLTPRTVDDQERMNLEELPAGDAFSSKPDHYTRRNWFWQTAEKLASQIRDEEDDRQALRRIIWSE